MSKPGRKRKLKSSLSDAVDEELNPPKEKLHINEDSDDEMAHILFGDSDLFMKHLEKVEPSEKSEPGVDSGFSEDSEGGLERKPVWIDEDDAGIDVGDALDAQHRKLPSGGVNDRKNKYSNLLKHKFETIVGTPKWAQLNKHKPGEESDEEILQSVGFVSKAPQTSLPAGLLEFKKLKDLNCETYTEGPFINAVEFHPTSSVGLVAGNKGVATLFAVDGKKNNKLHSVAFERYPILCAKFVKNRDEVILGSRLGHIFSYDLIGAKAVRYSLPPGMTQCKNFVVSPDSQFFAVAGKWGEVHLLSAASKEKIALLKQDSEVTALEFNNNSNLLFGHSDTGGVTIWDMNMRRVRHKFTDEGCLQGTTISASSSNQFLACGSAQGIVNLYGMEDVMKNKLPKPRKTIMNLTTTISSLQFNATSEILALSSPEIKNSIKLLHIGTGTVFSNFPPFESKFGHINCLNFTRNSGFLALGNRKSVVSLFRLKHFKNY